jgi:hypothetical protein
MLAYSIPRKLTGLFKYANVNRKELYFFKLLDPGRFFFSFRFLILHTIGMTPRTWDQPVLHTGQHTYRINKHPCMEWHYELKSSVFEWAKTVHVLDRGHCDEHFKITNKLFSMYRKRGTAVDSGSISCTNWIPSRYIWGHVSWTTEDENRKQLGLEMLWKGMLSPPHLWQNTIHTFTQICWGEPRKPLLEAIYRYDIHALCGRPILIFFSFGMEWNRVHYYWGQCWPIEPTPDEEG